MKLDVTLMQYAGPALISAIATLMLFSIRGIVLRLAQRWTAVRLVLAYSLTG